MKTLIINGSPRKQGDTVSLLNKLKEELAGEIVEISAYYDKIQPCIDCRWCWEEPRCVFKDKMDTIYDDDFDNVVIASPLYMSGLTGPLISLASRFQVYYAAEHFLKNKIEIKKKKGGLILVGGGDGTPTRAISYAKHMFKKMNATLDEDDIIASLHTNELPAAQDEDAINKVKILAHKLNGGHQ